MKGAAADTTDEIPHSLIGALCLLLFLRAFRQDVDGVSDHLGFAPPSLAGQPLDQSFSFLIDSHGEWHRASLPRLYDNTVLRWLHFEQVEMRELHDARSGGYSEIVGETDEIGSADVYFDMSE
jgi:hypothetical protein